MNDQITGPPHPSLHQVWVGAIARLAILIIALGVVAIGAVWFQQTRVTETTASLESRFATQAELTQALMGINGDAASGMMYGLDALGGLEAQQAEYEHVRTEINAAFDAMELIELPGESAERLATARSTWASVDATILGSPEAVASGEVERALAAGYDLWTPTVWQPWNEINHDIADIANANVEYFQLGIERQRQTSAITILIIVGSVLVGVVLAGTAVRRIKGFVLTPLMRLRQGAIALRDSELDHSVELDQATRELHELATTLNEAAYAIGMTQKVLRDQAYSDPLTGLPNRKAMTEHIEEILQSGDADRLGLLFIDLDDFKEINDSLGHVAGDELLRLVAHRIVSTAHDEDFVARLGGDEFAVAVDMADDPTAATDRAEAIIAAVGEPVVLSGTAAKVSCSVGIALGSQYAGTESTEALVRDADIAMYTAKSKGKSCYDQFAASMHFDMLARMELKRDLGRAVELDQLVLHYQPIVHLRSGDLLGFESLVRWHHPTRGLLGPGEFIPLAEDSDDILAIGAWVLDRSCRDLRRMRTMLPGGESLGISVNVSPRQVTDPTFVSSVLATIERHRLPNEAVTLELTEAQALSDTRHAAEVLGELRDRAVRIALDDFGIGYSSLRYVDELPIDVLKIDRSFVSDRAGREDAMLRSIIDMGERFGMRMIVEGIETPSEYERLSAYEQLAGQGYYIARPAPLDDVLPKATEALLTGRTRAATVWVP